MAEMDELQDALRAQRSHVLGALSGLNAEYLLTPVPPTTWSPIAVVRHLALDVERWWFQAIVAGDPRARQYFDDHPGGAWDLPEGVDPVEVFDLYDAECAASEAVVASLAPTNSPVWWPPGLGSVQTVREIMLHVVTETATHAGHLDIVRETIDGSRWLVLD
jgi:hypothetical protein